MKKLLFIPVFALCSFALILSSCDDSSEPEVTYMEEYESSDVYYPNFGSSTTYYTLYDANRLCSKSSGKSFVVTKTNQIINSADRCDRCGHCWYAHDKK